MKEMSTNPVCLACGSSLVKYDNTHVCEKCGYLVRDRFKICPHCLTAPYVINTCSCREWALICGNSYRGESFISICRDYRCQTVNNHPRGYNIRSLDGSFFIVDKDIDKIWHYTVGKDYKDIYAIKVKKFLGKVIDNYERNKIKC